MDPSISKGADFQEGRGGEKGKRARRGKERNLEKVSHSG